MIYMLHYNRRRGTLTDVREFEERRDASEAKLAVEIALIGSREGDEIVLLEADSLDALRKSHSRYFTRLEDFRIRAR